MIGSIIGIITRTGAECVQLQQDASWSLTETHGTALYIVRVMNRVVNNKRFYIARVPADYIHANV